MKRILFVTGIVIALLSSSGCHGQVKEENRPLKLNPNFNRDIQPDKHKWRGLSSLEVMINLADSLKLDKLANGFDSLEIRIWLADALNLRQQVIIMKYEEKKSSAYLCDFTPHLNKKMDSVIYFEKSITQINPRVPWGDLWQQLFGLRVLTLPDQRKLKDYPQMHDGNGVTIEIATAELYRMYSYNYPYTAASEFPEAAMVMKIILLIKSEFGVSLGNGF